MGRGCFSPPALGGQRGAKATTPQQGRDARAGLTPETAQGGSARATGLTPHRGHNGATGACREEGQWHGQPGTATRPGQGQGARGGWSYGDTPELWQEGTRSPCCSKRHHHLR